MIGPWTLDVASVPERPVRRAGALAWVTTREGRLLLALDPADGGWARLPEPAPGSTPLGLTADGSGLLLTVTAGRSRSGGVAVRSLATGELRTLGAPGGPVAGAALSPDGGTLAVLTTVDTGRDESAAVLALADAATGATRTLWSAAGGWSAESGTGWAPAGDRVAATYLTPDEDVATVVADLSGRVLAAVEGAALLPSCNGSWTADGRPVLLDEDAEEVVALGPGDEREVLGDAGAGRPRAVLDGRLLRHGRPTPDAFTLVAPDGPVLTLRPKVSLTVFDVALLAS